jgi:hypothetical protein
VYTEVVKNVTLSADESLIEAARRRAQSEQTTLNEAFRHWLAAYAAAPLQADRAAAVVDRLRGRLVVGPMPTRDERNAR